MNDIRGETTDAPPIDSEPPRAGSPRWRVSIRGLMVGVAVVGVLCLAAREAWERWMRPREDNPVGPSLVSATAGMKPELAWVKGRPSPISIWYDFRFRSPAPNPGTSCLLWAEVWLEDRETGLYVDGYTFDARLTVGGREAASGTFMWDAQVPHPGQYFIRSYLYFETSKGELQIMRGSGHSQNYVEDPPIATPAEPEVSP